MTSEKIRVKGPALDDLFADDDNELKPATVSLDALQDHNSPMVMLTYYRRIFPFKSLFHWLNHDRTPTKTFTHREFALTLQGDVYVRYNSFNTAEDLKKEIIRQNPTRFEIGPVYSNKPNIRKSLNKAVFKPQLRELVFDIDMTDYDSIRRCCKDKAMCKKCWKFITMAVKVLDRTLRDDFGFNHLLWVYSGRRGIHCWISDKAAMELTDDQRRSIVGYLEVIKGGAKQEKKVNLSRPLHPSIEAAYESLRPDFANVILREQDCFKDSEQWDAVLRMLPDDRAAARTRDAVKTDSTSIDRWKALRESPDTRTNEKKFTEAIEDIIIQYTYPRIDTEVSKKLNHLLKSPFCIHPGTGRVCVPLLASQVESFDPDACPTVGDLLIELETAAQNGNTTASWEVTSLRPYIEVFEKHISGIMKENTRSKVVQKSEMMEL